MSKSTKAILFITGALAIAGIGILSFLYFEPVRNIADQKADQKITAEELLHNFDENDKVADIKYKNKILELSGILKKKIIEDNICTLIFDNGGNFIIIANFNIASKNDLLQLNNNSKVFLKGIYNGYIINDDTFMIPAEIKIDKCSIVK